MSGIASVVLIVHIFIAVALVGVVLLQRSEGGALGIGGGSGSFMSAAGAGNALTRATMILAAMFFGTSILLTVLDHNAQQQLKLTTPAAKVTGLKTPTGPVSTPALPPAGDLLGAPPPQSVPGNSVPSPAATAPASQPVQPPKP